MYYCISMKGTICKNSNVAKFTLLLIFILTNFSFAQLKEKNSVVKWGSWLLLQAIPSPNFYEDKGNNNKSLRFGLEWQVIPLSYSWSANKYVSKGSFFKITPVKRFSGSAEVYFEPVLIPGGFKNNTLNKFHFKTGARFVLPVFHGGEYLAVSLGGGYYRQSTPIEKYEGMNYEAAVYSFYGMLGVKFNYSQNALSRDSFGIYIKYY